MQRSHRRCTLPAAAPKFDFNSPNSAMGDGRFRFRFRFGAIWRDFHDWHRDWLRSDAMRLASLRLWLPGSTLGPRIPPLRITLSSSATRLDRAASALRSGGRVRFASGGCSLPFPSRSPPPPPSLSLPLLRHPLLPAAIHPSIHHPITRPCSQSLPAPPR